MTALRSSPLVRATLHAIAKASPTLAAVVLRRLGGYEPPHFRVAELLAPEPRLKVTARGPFGPMRFRNLLPDEWAPVAAYRMEPECTRLVAKLPLPGALVFDVGGLFGYYAVLFSHAVGPKGVVLSFEPTPASFVRLVENLALNRCNNVCPIPLAISDSTGLAAWVHDPVHPWLDHLGDSVGTGLVGSVSLDAVVDAIGRPPDLIKIDVEGGGTEARVLRGASKLLAGGKSRVLLEVEEGPCATEAFAVLREHGCSWTIVERSPGNRIHILTESRRPG